MKASDEFKDCIKAELEKRAAEDELFAAAYQKPTKSLDQCIEYIFQEVQQSGRNGFADDEIYSIAVHYFEEDDLGEIRATEGRVVVNRHIELSDEEKEALRASAKKQFEDDCLREMKARNKKIAEASRATASAPTKDDAQPKQLSLFD